MKIGNYFQGLHLAVENMGAKKRSFKLKIKLPDLKEIDKKIKEGIEVTSKDIEKLPNGLLSYKGRHVLLYIQDHGSNIFKALQDGSQGKKYHVAWCRTLIEMEISGRYDRYVATNNTSGNFYIDGVYGNKYIKGEAKLNVCKNCLKHLQYQGYDYSSGLRIFNNFSLEEFFKTYQSHFKKQPKIKAHQFQSKYTDDWSSISHRYRSSKNWKCEECGVDLEDNKKLLHCHHINGVKQDNHSWNLKALCVECHSKQSSHNHMRVIKKDREKLELLRSLSIS